MSETTIEWTKRPGTVGATWNVSTGCNKVDRGCKNCYAEKMHKRLTAMGQPKYLHDFLDGALPWEAALKEPAKWRKPRTVFVNSMSDLFHEKIDFNFLIKVFQVIKDTPRHTYLVLTKRPERAWQFYQHMEVCSGGQWDFPPNMWLGTSINDQASADLRIPLLINIPARLHFVSYEPATGPADIRQWLYTLALNTSLNPIYSMRLDWVIMGGESGAKAQPMHPVWARHVRNACLHASVPFFFKQWGQWQPHSYLRDGKPYLPAELGQGEHMLTQPTPQLMRRTREKSFNLLDGQLHQNFPA
jgi:protein gp37